MYSKETFAIAYKLWKDDKALQTLISVLLQIQSCKRMGIVYSNQDFDIKQGLAAQLHSLAVSE